MFTSEIISLFLKDRVGFVCALQLFMQADRPSQHIFFKDQHLKWFEHQSPFFTERSS